MNSKSKRRLNVLDTGICAAAALSILGFVLSQAGHAGVNKIVKGQARLAIDVYFIGLKTSDLNLFKVGDKASLTIRNQPVYPPMTITAVKRAPRLIAFLSPESKKPLTFPDPTQPFSNDYVITISDQADVTPDGYVVRGNKVKVGNLIEIEGFKYRVQGIVLNVTPR